MTGRYRWHRHPKAQVELRELAPEPGPPPPPDPNPPLLAGASFQFWEPNNSMYIATGL
jgi:hypothetical protein